MLVQHRMSLIVVGRGVPSRVSLADKIGRFLLASFTARESPGLQESVISPQNFYFPLDMCCCLSSQCASKPLSSRDSFPQRHARRIQTSLFSVKSPLRNNARCGRHAEMLQIPVSPPLYLLSWNSDPQCRPSTAVGPHRRATGLCSQANRSRRLSQLIKVELIVGIYTSPNG